MEAGQGSIRRLHKEWSRNVASMRNELIHVPIKVYARAFNEDEKMWVINKGDLRKEGDEGF